jgi:chaperone required for assembly of F1-ATPase
MLADIQPQQTDSSAMRDIFEDIFQGEPVDPTELARRNMRVPQRRRFYTEAGVAEGEGDYRLLLDGKPVHTPARRPLAAPARALAETMAHEWRAQGDTIDPSTMPLTRLANAIIDGVTARPADVAAEVEKYLGSDLLFYRAPGPDGLVALQAAAWDPVIDWARAELGARFVLAEGLNFVPQTAEALAAASARIPRAASTDDLWRLGAVHAITTLTGSALIALAVRDGWLPPAQAWAAAHVDEDWNMDYWGRDEQALARRAARFGEMQAAATVLDALRHERT